MRYPICMSPNSAILNSEIAASNQSYLLGVLMFGFLRVAVVMSAVCFAATASADAKPRAHNLRWTQFNRALPSHEMARFGWAEIQAVRAFQRLP